MNTKTKAVSSLDTIDVDVCVFGAGMVGAASACALAQQGLRIALIEPYLPKPFSSEQAPELRVSALNRHSMNLLASLKALPYIEQMRFRSYDSLEVWEDSLSKTIFSAQDLGETQLGIFAENRIIQLALLRSISESYGDNIQIVKDKAQKVDVTDASVELQSGAKIQAKFLLGADGAQSQIRKAAGIGQTGWQYQQRANIICISMHQAIEDTTWQQFTPTGPLALLPMHDNFASLVWYADDESSAYIQSLDNEALKAAILERFPSRLADFDIINKAGFGLTRMHANQYWRHKAVLAGDAAHTINPLAGQGVNLGFKDVSALSDAVKEHGLHDLSGAFKMYEKQRRAQNLLMMSAMDALYVTFSNDIAPLKFARNTALMLAQRAGGLKNRALKYAMGI
jgi:2-octaprenyl-3-methyl-6-methoxy-1,4-benzoquinol hydroxylase